MTISQSAEHGRHTYAEEGLQLQLSRLRICICDLLVTNQRLRMELMERKEQPMRYVEMHESPPTGQAM